jgi:hypothetical protein
MPDEPRPDYFDQDNTDDQESTIREAETGPEEKPDYPPAVVPKSTFMGKDIEVGTIVQMRVQEIHDDEVIIVCEPEAETEAKSAEPAEPTVAPPTGDFE